MLNPTSDAECHLRRRPTTVPAEVEREFSPGLGLTYLENIFFEFRPCEAQAAEALAEDEASAIREQVDSRLPSPPFIFARDVNPRSGLYELSTCGGRAFSRPPCGALP